VSPDNVRSEVQSLVVDRARYTTDLDAKSKIGLSLVKFLFLAACVLTIAFICVSANSTTALGETWLRQTQVPCADAEQTGAQSLTVDTALAELDATAAPRNPVANGSPTGRAPSTVRPASSLPDRCYSTVLRDAALAERKVHREHAYGLIVMLLDKAVFPTILLVIGFVFGEKSRQNS